MCTITALCVDVKGTYIVSILEKKLMRFESVDKVGSYRTNVFAPPPRSKKTRGQRQQILEVTTCATAKR